MFFFLSFVSCFNFINIPKDKENNKLKIEGIKSNNFLFFFNMWKDISG